MGDAAVDRVLESRLCFVGYGDGGLWAIRHGQVHEQLGDVAGTEDFVDGREVGCAVLVVEIRCEDAAVDALPPQELASSAGRAKSCHLPPSETLRGAVHR